MPSTIYQGPIIDAHHHLWDLSLDRHPWLAATGRGDGLAPLRRTFLADDYRHQAACANIVATVHAEANWDTTDPFGEVEWLDRLARPERIAARYVAYAALADPDIESTLAQLAEHRRVAGIREILSWHPDPAKTRTADAGIIHSPAWRTGLAALQRHGLSFDLLISPWQLDDALGLASDHPDMRFVVNHCGSPMDRDAEGLDRWRRGVRALAAADNVVLKLSDPVAYDPQWTVGSLAGIINHCIDCFTPGRCMFASDYPVSALHISFEEWLAVFSGIVAGLSDTEKHSIFHDCAREVYQVPV
ncbi:amidohydrolase family protein [Hoeflea sp. YIM 152468]|uniref:amidohydrolase family protein n=1 Tax=Hoeflea sp. YIM 152468 TaxID=3031759 RepID=UPI0023DB98DF|nr:amidohydrolase family protein [Hoeflea sp. YIM 152468]MDF1608943.1 amidohydrolase family protein [Hoeflea sp. YIM 152468]